MIPLRERLPTSRFLQTVAHKDWDARVTWMEGKVAEINNGLPEPLLLYSKPREEEFEIANEAANMSVTVKREPNGNVVYRGTARFLTTVTPLGESDSRGTGRSAPDGSDPCRTCSAAVQARHSFAVL